MTGEFFLDIGGMILRVTDKDDVRERHFNGVSITGTNVLTQKYYSPYSETEIDFKAATGKEIMCYIILTATGGTAGQNSIGKIWASPVKDDNAAARDIFNTTYDMPRDATITPPAFILKAGEYLNVERTGGTGINLVVTKIVGVERDAT